MMPARRREGNCEELPLWCGAGSTLWFPELFRILEVKTTCTDRELGESVQTFIIYKIAVQRQIAWNPLKGEIPAPSGSCLAQAFSTGRKGRGKKSLSFLINLLVYNTFN